MRFLQAYRTGMAILMMELLMRYYSVIVLSSDSTLKRHRFRAALNGTAAEHSLLHGNCTSLSENLRLILHLSGIFLSVHSIAR